MQFKFFTIHADSPGDAESELNSFLRGHRVLTVHREFVPDAANPRWCLVVEYLEGGSREGGGRRRRIDYKEVLSPEDFALFVRLRDWRKEVAGREAVPVYTIFSNEQLAQIAEKRIRSLSGLKQIEGIGDARAEKYGSDVIGIVNETAVAGEKEEDGGP